MPFLIDWINNGLIYYHGWNYNNVYFQYINGHVIPMFNYCHKTNVHVQEVEHGRNVGLHAYNITWIVRLNSHTPTSNHYITICTTSTNLPLMTTNSYRDGCRNGMRYRDRRKADEELLNLWKRFHHHIGTFPKINMLKVNAFDNL